MFACGVILLAAVIVPVSGAYGSMEDESMRDAADGIAEMLDIFWNSKADEMTLRGWDILPSADCGLILDGRELILTKKGKEYRSLISHPAGKTEMSYNDMATVERRGGALAFTVQ